MKMILILLFIVLMVTIVVSTPQVIDDDTSGIEWNITKTGAEINLDVTHERINNSREKFCIGFLDKTKYVFEASKSLKDVSRIPITKTVSSTKFQIKETNMDLSKEDNKCFMVDYDGDVNFKIGWNSVIIDGAVTVSATSFNDGANLIIDSTGVMHVAYEGADDDLWYGSSSDGITWNTKEIYAGSIGSATILVNSKDELFISANIGDIDGWNSTNSGTTWSSRYTIIDTDFPLTGKPASGIVDKNDILHYYSIGTNGESVNYVNSTTYNDEQILCSAADDCDACDIATDSDGFVYIVCMGSDQDDLDLFSSQDNFATRHQIDGAMGTVGIGYYPTIIVNEEDNIYIAAVKSADIYIYNSSSDSITAGSWDNTLIDSATSYYPHIAVNKLGFIEILYQDQGDTTVQADSELYRANSSCPTCTWTARTELDIASGFGSIINTNYPSFNKLKDIVKYVYTKQSGVSLIYDSYSIPYIFDLSLDFFQPIESDIAQTLAGQNIMVNFSVKADDSNVTSDLTFNNANIGIKNVSITETLYPQPIIYIRSNDTGDTAVANPQTITFDTDYDLQDTPYSVLINELDTAASIYSVSYSNKKNESFEVNTANDGGTPTATDYMHGVIPYGSFRLDQDKYIKCGNRTPSTSQSTGRILFDEQFPDDDYTGICIPTFSSSDPNCVISENSLPKNSSGFTYLVKSTSGSTLIIPEVTYCAFSHGEYTQNNIDFKAGNVPTDADAVITITLDTPFPDTNYVVFTEHIQPTTAALCSCKVSNRQVGQFTITCIDSDGGDTTCDDADVTYDWIAISKGDYNMTYAITYDQFGYSSDDLWQVNLTAPEGIFNLQDLYLNATYNDQLINSTCKECINYQSADYIIQFIQPQTNFPISVNGGENISFNFSVSESGSNITTGLDFFNSFIGVNFTNILNDTQCIGTLDCSVYSEEGLCSNCSQCNWTSTVVPEQAIEFETFGTDLGNWVASGTADCIWTQDTDGTGSSGTGPCGGVSNCPGNDAGYDDNFYAYIETSGGFCDLTNDQGYLVFTGVDMDTYPDTKVFFAYNMYGTDMGILDLEIDDGVGGWDSLWSLGGNQGVEWFRVNVSLSPYTGTRNVRFHYDRNGDSGFRGDVTIDVLNITQFIGSVDGCTDLAEGNCLLCAIDECDTNCSDAGCSVEVTYQFGYVGNDIWQVNLTIPNGGFGLEDWFLNLTESVRSFNQTCEGCVNYGGVDSCTCAGLNQDWLIDMSDFCVIKDTCDLGTGTLSFENSGYAVCNATINSIDLGDPLSGNTLWVGSECNMLIGG